jgi:hypothetical protein
MIRVPSTRDHRGAGAAAAEVLHVDVLGAIQQAVGLGGVVLANDVGVAQADDEAGAEVLHDLAFRRRLAAAPLARASLLAAALGALLAAFGPFGALRLGQVAVLGDRLGVGLFVLDLLDGLALAAQALAQFADVFDFLLVALGFELLFDGGLFRGLGFNRGLGLGFSLGLGLGGHIRLGVAIPGALPVPGALPRPGSVLALLSLNLTGLGLGSLGLLDLGLLDLGLLDLGLLDLGLLDLGLLDLGLLDLGLLDLGLLDLGLLDLGLLDLGLLDLGLLDLGLLDLGLLDLGLLDLGLLDSGSSTSGSSTSGSTASGSASISSAARSSASASASSASAASNRASAAATSPSASRASSSAWRAAASSSSAALKSRLVRLELGHDDRPVRRAILRGHPAGGGDHDERHRGAEEKKAESGHRTATPMQRGERRSRRLVPSLYRRPAGVIAARGTGDLNTMTANTITPAKITSEVSATSGSMAAKPFRSM